MVLFDFSSDLDCLIGCSICFDLLWSLYGCAFWYMCRHTAIFGICVITFSKNSFFCVHVVYNILLILNIVKGRALLVSSRYSSFFISSSFE